MVMAQTLRCWGASTDEDVEEILGLELAVLGQVRAVDGVLDLVDSELRTQRSWPKHARNLGVYGAAESPKLLDDLIRGARVGDLDRDEGPARELVDHGGELGHDETALAEREEERTTRLARPAIETGEGACCAGKPAYGPAYARRWR